MTRGWTGLRASVIALAIGLGGTSGAEAAALLSDSVKAFIDYSTSGQIDPAVGITGTPVISFNSVAAASYTAPSSFSLGEFLVAPLQPGDVTTYNNTPFSITFLASKVDGSVPTINETPVILRGVLNGSVNGSSQSNVVATFDIGDVQTDPTANGAVVFKLGDITANMKVVDRTLSLVPSTTNGGRTTAQAQNIATVPEPGTIAVFLAAMAGLGLRRRMRLAPR